MKTAAVVVLFGLCTLTALAEPPAVKAPPMTDEHLEQLLMQAVMLARAGLYDEAEARCKEILEQKPEQPTVKQLLREIDEHRRRDQSRDPGYELRRTLEQTIVPEVNFRAAAPADVIEFLRAESKKLTSEKSEINFVWQVPADAKLAPVTLNLRKIPMLDVIDYVTQLARLRCRLDAHAVVIYQPQPETPVPPATEPNVKPQ